MSQQTQTSESDVPSQRRRSRGSVSALTPGARPIAGMKPGWLYREDDRTIIHLPSADGVPLVIGQVPEIVATITHLTDDGEDIRTEYLARGKRQRRPRILTEDELDRGTWAAKMGCRRPTGSDEKHAFARLIREEGDKAPVVPARTYYNEAGDLVFPEADAQTLGYRVLRGEEDAAREAWEEIGTWSLGCGKSALVIGAVFAGPVLDSLDVLAHMVNCYGPGQQGKSTIATVACAGFGDIKPRRQQILITWNSSKQGITQSLRQRGFLPIGLDEHSSSGRRIHESSREISQMVSGAVRAMGTADGSPKESDGFWLSCALSTSNEPLKHEGQTEDLATRLQEFQAPFFPNVLLLPDGTTAPAGHPGAEHVSKRLKRLAKGFGGWPLEWAIRKGMFRAQNLAQLKKLHLELCAKHRPAQGGIAATIAELHMAWVVGAHMFAEAIGVPGLGLTAEEEAARRLQAAIVQADEANLPDHEKLWQALDALRIEKSAFPDMDRLPTVAEEGFRRLRGFYNPDAGEWWVVNPVVHEAGVQAGIDNVSAALRELDGLGVHIRGTGKNAQRLLPKSIRYAGLGERMHCFNTRRAAELFSADDESDAPEGGYGAEFPSGATPRSDPGATPVAPENSALTSTGATGATGATLSLLDIPYESAATPRSDPGATVLEDVAASRRHDVTTVQAPPMPSVPPAVPYPPARMLQPGEAGHDRAWLSLESRAQGRTRSALAVGVLGADGLYLPNHAPVAVPLPGSVDDVPALMTAYGLKTLWVHASALAPLGLPSYEERRALGAAQERAAKGLSADEPVKTAGSMSPVAHPWAVPAAGSPVAAVVPEGLTAWMTLKLADTASGLRRLSVAIPAYEDRFDKARQEGRGGFGGAPAPEMLLDALMVWTLSTVHGTQERPKVIPYYLSPNRVGEDFAGGRDRDDVVCRAVRDRAVPPALGVRLCPLLVPQQWHRDPSEAERAAGWLHRYDKTAAWLAAYGPTKLGVGEPTHGGEGTAYSKAMAGFWRVADVPGTGPEGLPELQVREVEEGGYWLTTPSVELLRELYPAWTPRVLESWHWETSKAALSGMYKLMSTSRTRIVAAADEGRPGAKWAKQVNGRVYQSFRGYLARATGPQTDHATGGDYRQDIYYRPDWAAMLISHATANMYRNLVRFRADGHYPLSVYVDAVTLTSDQADPIAAKPDSMVIGNRGGNWTTEGSAPMTELLPLLEDRDNRHGAHSALDQFLNRGE